VSSPRHLIWARDVLASVSSSMDSCSSVIGHHHAVMPCSRRVSSATGAASIAGAETGTRKIK
jgi:hypothetical protein